jgi:CRISPR-associated endoribonuclease Cas6
MPAVVTIQLEAPNPLFFDEAWPLEGLFLEILQRSQPHPLGTERRNRELKPYTLSPIWHAYDRQLSVSGGVPEGEIPTAYQWRAGLLDDALTSHFLHGLEGLETLSLEGKRLNIGNVATEERTYHDIVEQAQVLVSNRPDEQRRIHLEFLTPAILYRSGLPMPLPDPSLVFRHYLSAWDTFAPRELWANFNLLDAVTFHVAVTKHRLETRRVQLAGGKTKVGCLGKITYTAMAWRKLGAEFLARLHMLAQFSEFCGTGELTTHGLGQTQYMSGKK